ncbi:MAG: MATE family efflux transporter [Clostridia bacterium]|nr:MATE family efflux transporter [Clostridia bacterium]
MVATKTKGSFTEGSIFSKLLFFVLPIAATNLLQTFYNAADMMVVSMSSETNAVGAIGTTTSFISLVVNIFIGFSVGANVVVARAIGANDGAGAKKAVHTALLIGLMIGLLGCGVGLLIARPVLSLMGNQDNLLELAVRYTQIYFLGIPFLALTNYLSAIFRAKGDAKTPLIILSTSGAVNVLLNLFFVLVLGMSVEGVALATVAANILSVVLLTWKLSRDRDMTTFSFSDLRIDIKSFAEIVRIGLPAGIQGSLFSLSNMLIQSSVVSVNNASVPPGTEYQPIVNGNAASANLMNFTYAAMNAVSQGAVTFTGQNMGAKKPERVKPILYNCFLITLMIAFVFTAILLLLKEPLFALYGVKKGAEGSLERMAFEAANLRMWLIGAPYFLFGLMDNCSGVLRGLGRSLLSTIISLVGTCLLRVVWLWVFFPMNPTLTMIFICYPITWILTGAVDFIVIQILLKKILNKKDALEKEGV